MTAAPPLLAIRDLSVRFGTAPATPPTIEHIDLELRKGEIVGLVGESGSGKSLLAYSILGLGAKTAIRQAGELTLAGMDLLTASESDLRDIRGRQAAIVFQNARAALNPIRTVGRQIADVIAQHRTVERRRIWDEVVSLLAAVQINDPASRAHAYPFELSGGTCQRVMIAMALAAEPALIIADEPTSGLDASTQAAVLTLLYEQGRARQLSLLLITHDLVLARTWCDRIAVMHAGHIVEIAPTERLFARPYHPYTAKLIAASPAHAANVEALTGVPGAFPDLSQPQPPCRYVERCERVLPLCRTGRLEKRHFAPDHWVACGNPL